jgi:hypothetical protein
MQCCQTAISIFSKRKFGQLKTVGAQQGSENPPHRLHAGLVGSPAVDIDQRLQVIHEPGQLRLNPVRYFFSLYHVFI